MLFPFSSLNGLRSRKDSKTMRAFYVKEKKRIGNASVNNPNASENHLGRVG